MAERLNALDATFLELEEGNPCVHMHIGGIMVFDPPPGGSTPSLKRLSAMLEQRLAGLPRYRQRLSETTTGGVRWPAWVEDERFAMERHCRRAILPAPGDRAELECWAAEFFSQRLDRSAPLWEMVLVEGLEGGRWAIGSKTHHCMVDGVGSVGVAEVLLDTEPDPRRADDHDDELPHPTHHDDEHGSWWRWTPPGLAVRAARAGVDAALHPGQLVDAAGRARATAEMLVRDEIVAAPRSSINAPISAHRRFTVVDIELDAVKAIKRNLGGTVNDVVLAAVAGGLRELLEDRGETPPDAGLRAMVPVNVRDASDKLGLGNRISSLFVPLPVNETDAASRFQSARASAARLKSGTEALGSKTLIDLLALAPPALHSAFAQGLFATRLFNVTVTNVPGPQLPLYALGSRMREVWPLVPLAADHSVGVAIVSYDGWLFFGLVADRDVDDLDVLASGVRRSLEELAVLANGENGRRVGEHAA